MSEPGKTDRSLLPYLTAILLLGAAVFLIVIGNTALGLGTLGLAGLSWFTSRRLLSWQSKPDRKWLLDERLLQTQKLAAMGELAAGVAHEINNPLAIIRQEAEWTGQVLRQAELPESSQLAEVRDSLREIVQQVDRARDITTSLLNLARKREPVIQKVDLNRLIRDMAALVEKETKSSNILLIRRLQEGLPFIDSDAPLLRQVILNLLNNARQAVEKDGRITITTRQVEDRQIVITIADTGCGIPPEQVGHIFDPFFTTKAPGSGTGLGLAISRSIIHSLGGDITAASRAGEGAEFNIVLPLRPEAGGTHAATA